VHAGDAETAAILTPYKGQVRALEHALRVLQPWFGADLLSRISISSVDGFQGREADAVVFSAVRCAARADDGVWLTLLQQHSVCHADTCARRVPAACAVRAGATRAAASGLCGTRAA
jgi:hypothetical protein